MSFDVDIVVVGAGIHGAGVAQAAAAAGHRVRVLEARAVAAGTSSRSSKLIHGGLRYLENGHLGLVREAISEREVLLRIAPDLVHLVPFYLPIYRETRRRPAAVRAGLMLYALLGRLRASARFQRIDRSEWPGLDGLRTRGLQAVYRYYDAQTDDTALTQAVLNSAVALGAEFLCPARFVAARIGEDGVAIDVDEGEHRHTWRARALVNAAGPWVNEVLAGVTPRVPCADVECVQGAHALIPGELHRGIYYLEAPSDRRPVFAMPWRGAVLVGTTETAYAGDPAEVIARPDEIAYLREALTHYFPALDAPPRQTFAGLRVLPRGRGAFSHRSRATELALHESRPARLVSIVGGKLTMYRRTALKVLARLAPVLPPRSGRADTARLPLKS